LTTASNSTFKEDHGMYSILLKDLPSLRSKVTGIMSVDTNNEGAAPSDTNQQAITESPALQTTRNEAKLNLLEGLKKILPSTMSGQEPSKIAH
jgi:hypothetical protein